jgi:hypothetical protein
VGTSGNETSDAAVAREYADDAASTQENCFANALATLCDSGSSPTPFEFTLVTV